MQSRKCRCRCAVVYVEVQRCRRNAGAVVVQMRRWRYEDVQACREAAEGIAGAQRSEVQTAEMVQFQR